MSQITMDETVTAEGLLIRVERQRERAEKWTSKYEQLEESTRQKEKEHQIKIEELQQQIVNLGKEHQEKLDENQEKQVLLVKRIGALIAEKRDENFERLNAERKLDNLDRVIKLGKKQLQKQLKQRRQKLVKKLVSSGYIFNYELVDWLRRAIKRDCNEASHVPVVLVDGWTCDLVGKPGYYTTPSGKTVVTYPKAYGYRTVYHCSTEQIDVGRGWIARNIHRLAKAEADFRIKE